MFSRVYSVFRHSRFSRLLRPLHRVTDLAEDVLIAVVALLLCAWVFNFEDESLNGDFLEEFAREFSFSFTACVILGLILAAGLRLTADSPKAKSRLLSQHAIRSELLRLALLVSAIVVSIKGVTPYQKFFGPLQWQISSSAVEHLWVTILAYLVLALLFLSAIGALRWGGWPARALSINPRTFLTVPGASIGFGVPWYQLRSRTRTSVAFLVSLAVVAIGIGARTIPDLAGGHYVTVGTWRIVTLRDRSQLVLNRHTEVDTQVTLLSRKIRVVHGEVVLSSSGSAAWHNLDVLVDDVRMSDFAGFQAHIRWLGPERMEVTVMHAALHIILPERYEKFSGYRRHLSLLEGQRLTIAPNAIFVEERSAESMLDDLAWATVGGAAERWRRQP